LVSSRANHKGFVKVRMEKVERAHPVSMIYS